MTLKTGTHTEHYHTIEDAAVVIGELVFAGWHVHKLTEEADGSLVTELIQPSPPPYLGSPFSTA